MTEKPTEVLEVKKIQDVINKVLVSYAEEYKVGRMSFGEYAIIENISVRLQKEFNKELGL